VTATQLTTIHVNNHLDAQFSMYVYFYSLHVSGSHVPIIRRIVVSMWHLVYVTLCRWPSGMQVIPDGQLHRVTRSYQTVIYTVTRSYQTVIYTEWPDHTRRSSTQWPGHTRRSSTQSDQVKQTVIYTEWPGHTRRSSTQSDQVTPDGRLHRVTRSHQTVIYTEWPGHTRRSSTQS